MGTPRVAGTMLYIWRVDVAKQFNIYRKYMGFWNPKEFEFCALHLLVVFQVFCFCFFCAKQDLILLPTL